MLNLNRIDKDAVAQQLLNMWMNAEYPLDTRPREWWVTAFTRLGYSSDGRVGEKLRPADGLVLCRGAVESARDGLSWTPNIELARWFAERCGGELWVCWFPPSALLARMGPQWGDVHIPGCSEFICDPAGLLIEEY
ncbi:hypothetical protein [Rhodococcus wratislaviensis]|uniref:hypothetical protein n=1 Tax=Rhodococcus wratislaviensis TaxID=44752 RepID=UPI00366652CA